LLAYHADPNAQVNPEGRRNELYGPVTALQYAASLGNNRTVARLIAAGAKIDTQGPAGRSALHFSLGHLDVMRYLISQGADVNARDVEGTSALDDAVWRGSLDAAAILLAHGAKLNEGETKSGATPLNEAAYRGKTEIVRYLLQFKPDLEIADKRGYAPLENAIRMGHQDAAVLLLDAEPKERKTSEFLKKTMEAAIRKDEAALWRAFSGRERA
jgi:ankyrin repeat protein